MKELEKTARELILAIAEKTLKTLKDNGMLKQPSKLQLLYSSTEMKSLIKKLSAPKYDPCRKFREGDVVDVIEAERGRTAFLYLEGDETPGDGHWVVTADEDASGRVNICYNGERCARVWYNMLKLVTPVEELERYYIEHDATGFAIVDRLNVGYVAHFKAVQHPHAKEAAEAERDRLNAEHRKETK